MNQLLALADCDARAGEPLGKCMREAAARIAELEAEVARRWQPIETAPKDGTAFLAVCEVDCGTRNHWIARWAADTGIGGSFVCGSDAEGLTDLSNDVCVACLAWWMPLPEPPTSA